MEFIGDYGLILMFFVVAVIFVLQPLFLSDLGKIVVELDKNGCSTNMTATTKNIRIRP
jgi:hypothetical protein